jgi:hypothetical protein
MPAKTDRTMPDNHSEPANRQNHQSGGVHNAAVECRSPPGHQSVSTRPRPEVILSRISLVVTPSWSRGEIREADRDGMLSPDLDRRMLNVVQGPVCTRHAILTGPCLSVIRPKISSDWRCQCTSRILTELCKEWIWRTYLLVGLGRMSKAISRTNIGSGIWDPVCWFSRCRALSQGQDHRYCGITSFR